MLYDFWFVDHFDCIDILRGFMAHLVHFTESTHSDVGVGQRFKIVFSALSFLAISDTGWQE